MVLGILKQANKWLLTSLVILTPYVSIGAEVEDLLMLAGGELAQIKNQVAFKNQNKNKESYQKIVRGFTKLTIDKHDYALSSLWTSEGNPTFPSSILTADAQNLAIALSTWDPRLDSNYLLQLFSDYNVASNNYIFQLSIFSCTFPNSLEEFASEWRRSAVSLANFLSSNSSECKARELRLLFLSWVNAQITDFNNATPSCLIPTSPNSISAANAAYAQSRAFSFFIADKVFELLAR